MKGRDVIIFENEEKNSIVKNDAVQTMMIQRS